MAVQNFVTQVPSITGVRVTLYFIRYGEIRRTNDKAVSIRTEDDFHSL